MLLWDGPSPFFDVRCVRGTESHQEKAKKKSKKKPHPLRGRKGRCTPDPVTARRALHLPGELSEPGASLVAQRHERVHAHRSPRRNVACCERDPREQQGYAGKCGRI